MSRYIDATELSGYKFGLISPYAQKLFHRVINETPTADVRANVHAHWESIGEAFQCSRCGTLCAVTETATHWIWHINDKFCRGCGAVMDEEVEE